MGSPRRHPEAVHFVERSPKTEAARGARLAPVGFCPDVGAGERNHPGKDFVQLKIGTFYLSVQRAGRCHRAIGKPRANAGLVGKVSPSATLTTLLRARRRRTGKKTANPFPGCVPSANTGCNTTIERKIASRVLNWNGGPAQCLAQRWPELPGWEPLGKRQGAGCNWQKMSIALRKQQAYSCQYGRQGSCKEEELR